MYIYTYVYIYIYIYIYTNVYMSIHWAWLGPQPAGLSIGALERAAQRPFKGPRGP